MARGLGFGQSISAGQIFSLFQRPRYLGQRVGRQGLAKPGDYEIEKTPEFEGHAALSDMD